MKYVTGVESTLRSLRKRFDTNVKRNVTVAIKAMAQDVYDVSQELVPVDTQALKRSGKITHTWAANGLLEATVTYGGPEAYYALWVHENLEAYHAPPTCAKFLERAVAQAKKRRKEILKRIFDTNMAYSKEPVK